MTDTSHVTGDGRWFTTNVQRAGELFMHSLWIQGQMCDLTIFANHPQLVEPFHETPARMPQEFVTLRLDLWQRDFGPIRDSFVMAFRHILNAQHLEDLEFIYALRNAIAHCHLSIGRDYFLYRPQSRREEAVIAGLDLQPRDNAMSPPVINLAFFHYAYYLSCFARIQRLDEQCLARAAAEVGVTHSRIR